MLVGVAVAVALATALVSIKPLSAQDDSGLTASPVLTLTIPGRAAMPIVPVLPNPRRVLRSIPVLTAGPVTGPAYYLPQPGEAIDQIAAQLGVERQALMAANGMLRPDTMVAGVPLRVPGPDGQLPPWATATVAEDGAITLIPRKSAYERLTPAARGADQASPYYRKIWVTYYGRPGIALMGIVGEHDPATLVQLVKEKAAEYDLANGPQLGVQPAVHLVWGMATVEDQPDDSHLGYLSEAEVMPYIEEGLKEGVAVILDSQIAGRSPAESIAPALPYLKFPNVHLAIDPEFAMAHPGQTIPGDPIGYVTAEQVNEVERAMAEYMAANQIEGKRILMVHQFQSNMIIDKANLDATFPEVELTLSVDGFGNPYVKTWKYNTLVDEFTPFTSFKLFYGWDEPLMTPRQALGVDGTEHTDFIEVTPNMIQYQYLAPLAIHLDQENLVQVPAAATTLAGHSLRTSARIRSAIHSLTDWPAVSAACLRLFVVSSSNSMVIWLIGWLQHK